MQNLIGNTIYARRSKDHMLEPAILINILEHQDKEETFIVEFTKDKLRLEVDSIMKKAGWQEIKFTKEDFFDDKYFIKNDIFVKLEKIKEKEILLKQLNSTIKTNLLTKIIKFIKRKI